MKHDYSAPQAVRDKTEATMVRALRHDRGDADDLPEAIDLPDNPEGHLAMGVGRGRAAARRPAR